MIEYNKVNDCYAEILHNDVKIGILERYSDFLIVEVCYTRMKFNDSHKRLIKGYIEKLYFKLNKPKVRMKKSILQTNYKILD